MSESALPARFQNGIRYYRYSQFLRERFDARVYRVTIDAGFTCPNVDGTVTTGGCVYCDNRSFSPYRRLPRKSITEQVNHGIEVLTRLYRAEKFIAYFQAATNTHGEVEKLKRLYDEAINHPQIIGLIIGTRPDSVPEPVLQLIEDYAKEYYVSLELGLQTIHDRSLDWMNRGHHNDVFVDAIERSRGRGFELSAHVILGLPDETHEDMLATADAVAAMPIESVKIHNLHVIRHTPLEEQYLAGEVRMLERDEYVHLVCDFLERIPEDVVVQRLTGDAPDNYLVAPMWCLEKAALLQEIQQELVKRDSWQGKRCTGKSVLVDELLRARSHALPLI